MANAPPAKKRKLTSESNGLDDVKEETSLHECETDDNELHKSTIGHRNNLLSFIQSDDLSDVTFMVETVSITGIRAIGILVRVMHIFCKVGLSDIMSSVMMKCTRF